jgi:hypothetical protein
MTSAIFPRTPMRAGIYESFYLRAVAREEPLAAWIRCTVHKRPGERPCGSVWCTVFDPGRGEPFMHKLTTDELSVPQGGWIAVGGAGGDGAVDRAGECGAVDAVGPGGDGGGAGADRPTGGALLSRERARGACGPARWSLSIGSREPELRHLPREWLYRTPLPRTKLTSPEPAASFDGTVRIEGREELKVRDWVGMVGHNWGSQHAERWIWLHGVGFDEAPEAWLDVALARVRVGGLLTPWLASGAVSLAGWRHRVGGLAARRLSVAETVEGCVLRLVGEGGMTLNARIEIPAGGAAGWRYADPSGSPHDVLNCSVASLALTVKLPGQAPRSLHSAHGGAYELGMREQDHGVPIAPFPDGRPMDSG